MNEELHFPGLFKHLWQSYKKSIDGRQKNGDLSILAEAAERVPWPEAPELGREIAAILRQLDWETKTGKHDRNVRDNDVYRLVEMQVNAGMPVTKSRKCVADIFGMTIDNVREVVNKEKKRLSASSGKGSC